MSFPEVCWIFSFLLRSSTDIGFSYLILANWLAWKMFLAGMTSGRWMAELAILTRNVLVRSRKMEGRL